MLRCKQCDLWKSTPEKQISFEDAKIIIDKLHSWLGDFYLFFTGGEPFMNQDLIKIIRYAEDLGIMTHVNSNAFIINDTLAQKIVDSHLSRISISLDGGNALTHDHLRGIPGAFDRVLKGIGLLQKFRGKDGDLKIYLNSVIMRPNVKELPQIIDVARASKVDGLTFQNLLPTLFTKRTASDMFKDPLWPKFTDLKNTLEKIIADETAHDVLFTSNDAMRSAIAYYKDPHVIDKVQCAAGINNFIVNRLGEVSLCFTYPSIGNIFQDDPKTIWGNPRSVQQRQAIRRCKKPCKATLCNKVDTNRHKTIIMRAFERSLNQDPQ